VCDSNQERGFQNIDDADFGYLRFRDVDVGFVIVASAHIGIVTLCKLCYICMYSHCNILFEIAIDLARSNTRLKPCKERIRNNGIYLQNWRLQY
jgi:hypothetical protein